LVYSSPFKQRSVNLPAQLERADALKELGIASIEKD
jgi:hypothetical protein